MLFSISSHVWSESLWDITSLAFLGHHTLISIIECLGCISDTIFSQFKNITLDADVCWHAFRFWLSFLLNFPGCSFDFCDKAPWSVFLVHYQECHIRLKTQKNQSDNSKYHRWLSERQWYNSCPGESRDFFTSHHRTTDRSLHMSIRRDQKTSVFDKHSKFLSIAFLERWVLSLANVWVLSLASGQVLRLASGWILSLASILSLSYFLWCLW